jgi:hypothetical protein
MKYLKEFGKFKLNEEVSELVGKRIRLIEMKNDPDPIEPGSEGTIVHAGGGVINVDWDSGRSLGVVEGIDEYEIFDNDQRDTESEELYPPLLSPESEYYSNLKNLEP